MAAFADAIEPQQDIGGAISFPVNWLPEEAGQTFLYGMPVQVNATDGGVQIWDGTTVAAGIAGFAIQNGQNLGTTGAGAAAPFSPILGAGSSIGSYAANSSQSLAVITPPMVPMSNGLTGFAVAAPTTVFMAKVGSSSGTPGAIATTAQMVGTLAGLTKDSVNNFWYVDTNKNNTVRIVGLYPGESTGTVGGHVLFIVLPAAAQIIA